MAVVCLIGGQWGDEGKGKVVDMLASQAHIVARCQGGSNAGHTVVNNLGTFRMHLIPSGIFHPQVITVIGNGVMVDLDVITGELDALAEKGVDTSRLRISERAHVVMPYHVLQDRLEEEARGSARIGTTGRGIGPAFADKTARLGIRMAELIREPIFLEKLSFALDLKNRMLTNVFGAQALSKDEIAEKYLRLGRRLAPYVGNVAPLIQGALSDKKNILLEGAHGSMLDPDFGTYPFVTSSSPTVAGSCLGCGIGPSQLDAAIAIYKAYNTRVGQGPFPTELQNEIGEHIREKGHEYGTTTGRPRRCGWFDGVAARFVAETNGLTSMAITRLDVLDGIPELQICTAYRIGGTITHDVPATVEGLAEVEPVYEKMPGWSEPTGDVRRYEDLPANARAYVDRLAELVGARLDVISVGSGREQTIVLRNTFDI